MLSLRYLISTRKELDFDVSQSCHNIHIIALLTCSWVTFIQKKWYCLHPLPISKTASWDKTLESQVCHLLFVQGWTVDNIGCALWLACLNAPISDFSCYLFVLCWLHRHRKTKHFSSKCKITSGIKVGRTDFRMLTCILEFAMLNCKTGGGCFSFLSGSR